jgi:hypothetical protein
VRLTLARARRALGPALDLQVDATMLGTYVTGKLPGVRRARQRLSALRVPAAMEQPLLDIVARSHPFILAAADYPPHWPVDEDPKYSRLEDLLDHLEHPETTTWWTYALERIASEGSYRMKDGRITDEAGLRRHLETYLMPLIDAFRRDGYRADLDRDPGLVHVGPDGSLHKTNKGAHRFLLARRFGGDPLRVRILCVHSDWWDASTSGRTVRARLVSATDALRGVAAAHRR